MGILALILIIVLAAAIFYLFSLRPEKTDPERFRPFEKVLIAHRGYYDNDSDAPENSLPAFKKAVERGLGIELDVQITTDGKLVVFHDETLRRMCGANRVLTELSYDELSKYRLMDSDEKIPLFADVFDVIRGRVPLLVELKAHGDYIKTAETLMTYLDGYDGDYAVQSFHPGLVHWFLKNRPDVLRGQLSMIYKPGKVPWIARFVATNLMTNFYAKPEFISYNYGNRDQFSFRLVKRLYHVKNACWTIRSKKELQEAKKIFDIYIFDSFDPMDVADD